MDCEKFEALISARIDGEIAAADVRPLEEHLAACDLCRAIDAALRAQDRELREAFAARSRSAAELGERLAGELRRFAPSPALPRGLAAAAAALIVGLVLGWLAFGRQNEAPRAPSVAQGDGSEAPSPRVVADPTRIAAADPADAPAPAPPVSPAGDESSRQTRLVLATGPVEVALPDERDWQPLSPGAALAAGSRVRCDKATRAEIAAADGSVVRLDAASEVVFAGGRRWELSRGRLWSEVAKAEEPFVIAVAEATVTALGTRFDVATRESGAVVSVFEGSIRVLSGRLERVVRRGELAEIESRDAARIELRELRPESLTQAASWMNDLLVLKGRDSPELARRVDELLAGLGAAKMEFLGAEEIRSLGVDCVVPLLKYIESARSFAYPARRRQAASIVADLATEEATAELIDVLADRDSDVRARAAQALARLTGLDHGMPPEQWEGARWEECEPTYLRWVAWYQSRQAVQGKAAGNNDRPAPGVQR